MTDARDEGMSGLASGRGFAVSRRGLIKGAAAAALLPATSARLLAAAGELKVATYGGSWQKAIESYIAPDMEKGGAKLSFTIASPDDNLAKVIAAKRYGDVPFDVMDGTPYLYNDALKTAQALMPVNLS